MKRKEGAGCKVNGNGDAVTAIKRGKPSRKQEEVIRISSGSGGSEGENESDSSYKPGKAATRVRKRKSEALAVDGKSCENKISKSLNTGKTSCGRKPTLKSDVRSSHCKNSLRKDDSNSEEEIDSEREKTRMYEGEKIQDGRMDISSIATGVEDTSDRHYANQRRGQYSKRPLAKSYRDKKRANSQGLRKLSKIKLSSSVSTISGFPSNSGAKLESGNKKKGVIIQDLKNCPPDCSCPPPEVWYGCKQCSRVYPNRELVEKHKETHRTNVTDSSDPTNCDFNPKQSTPPDPEISDGEVSDASTVLLVKKSRPVSFSLSDKVEDLKGVKSGLKKRKRNKAA